MTLGTTAQRMRHVFERISSGVCPSFGLGQFFQQVDTHSIGQICKIADSRPLAPSWNTDGMTFRCTILDYCLFFTSSAHCLCNRGAT